MSITFAVPDEANEISGFFDKFLAPRGFIPQSVICGLIDKKKYVYLTRENGKIVAVAIGRSNGTLWNLLVHPDFRRKGLGRAMVEFLNPRKIRVKWTGYKGSETEDPTGFFEKLGYRFVEYVVPREKWKGKKNPKPDSEATIKVMRKVFQISIPSIETAPISSLRVDNCNPNRMTSKQLESLAESIKRWGFIAPIVTNQDLLIADGEQRYTVAKMLGMKEAPVIRLPVQDVDRRLLRQVLNKLKGEHEPIADAEEFKRIIDADCKDDLKTLLAINDENIQVMLKKLEEGDQGLNSLNSTFEVIITCQSEEKQKEAFEDLKQRGYTCQIHTVK